MRNDGFQFAAEGRGRKWRGSIPKRPACSRHGQWTATHVSAPVCEKNGRRQSAGDPAFGSSPLCQTKAASNAFALLPARSHTRFPYCVSSATSRIDRGRRSSEAASVSKRTRGLRSHRKRMVSVTGETTLMPNLLRLSCRVLRPREKRLRPFSYACSRGILRDFTKSDRLEACPT